MRKIKANYLDEYIMQKLITSFGLSIALFTGAMEAMDVDVKKELDNRLHIAVYIGDEKEVEQLLMQGADVESKDFFPSGALKTAIKREHYQVCKLLLAHKARHLEISTYAYCFLNTKPSSTQQRPMARLPCIGLPAIIMSRYVHCLLNIKQILRREADMLHP
jgi:hypothetical protein